MSRNDFCLSSASVHPEKILFGGARFDPVKPSRLEPVDHVDGREIARHVRVDLTAGSPAGHRRVRCGSSKPSIERWPSPGRSDTGRPGRGGLGEGDGPSAPSQRGNLSSELCQLGRRRKCEGLPGRAILPAAIVPLPSAHRAGRATAGRSYQTETPNVAAAAPSPAIATKTASLRSLTFSTAKAMTAIQAKQIRRAAVHRVGLPTQAPGASRRLRIDLRSLEAISSGPLSEQGRSSFK